MNKGSKLLKTNETIFDNDVRGLLTKALQPSLIDLKALSLITKQCHWNVTGPFFRPIHLHLDEIYDAVEESVDETAERLSTIGVSPNAQASDVAAASTIPEVPKGFLKDANVVEMMTERLSDTCHRLRERMETIEDADPVTADMFHAILARLEKNLWMLRVQQA